MGTNTINSIIIVPAVQKIDEYTRINLIHDKYILNDIDNCISRYVCVEYIIIYNINYKKLSNQTNSFVIRCLCIFKQKMTLIMLVLRETFSEHKPAK